MVKSAEYFFGIGRRKSSIAQVRISKGSGKFVNAKRENLIIDKSFTKDLIEPLELLSLTNKFDVSFIVHGGGASSQKEAIKLGLSRALSKVAEENEKTLKKANLLSRDSREKERKKPGLKKARRAPQWAKR